MSVNLGKVIDQSGAVRQARSGALRAQVRRADGTIEDRGIVAYSHTNPVINFVLSPLARFNGWCWERYYRIKRKLQ